MLKWLDKFLGRGETPKVETEKMRRARLALEDLESWFYPPEDPQDERAWDAYWIAQMKHGVVGMTDMFVKIRGFIEALEELENPRILCAGSGMSLEPLALAASGADVSVLELSGQAVSTMRAIQMDSTDVEALCERFDGTIGAMGPPSAVQWHHGDIFDLDCCPGPFDLIIERRTAQTYPEAVRSELLDRLAARLGPDAILFSHCHVGGWRPPDPRPHFTRPWLEARNWQVWKGPPSPKPPGQVAWLMTSTG